MLTSIQLHILKTVDCVESTLLWYNEVNIYHLLKPAHYLNIHVYICRLNRIYIMNRMNECM